MLSANLPDDVMTNILGRLPSKSLVRFKVVAKSWYALLTNAAFVTHHYQTRSAITNNDCIVVKRLRTVPKDHTFSFIYTQKYVDLDPPLLKDTVASNVNVVASCNGILCLSYCRGREGVALWNPAIREFKALPNPHIPSIPPPHMYFAAGSPCLGFGLDPKTNDYKVVRIWSWFHRYSKALTNKVEVWRPGDHSWRQIHVDPPDAPVETSYAYIKGRCYWGGEGGDSIVSFDLGDEDFRLIPLPPARGGGAYRWSLTALNESLAFACVEKRENKHIEIWVMNEYYCWAKCMVVDVPLAGLRPIGFVKDRELLLQENRGGKLLFHDPIAGGIVKDVQFGVNNLFNVVAYNESLVSINGGIRLRKRKFSRL